MHVYRWDLDKTYLDTEFGSVRSMIRTALETALEKRNVPGSAALLRALAQADPDARVSIISGSPTQMRKVLEEKLALDGVHFDHFVLKDNLGNLRRGRLRAVRNQLGYKLPAMLEDRVGLPPNALETCFGDDLEVDALVYSVYADAVAGRLTPDELAHIMDIGGAYPDHITAALAAMERVQPAEAVSAVFIHISRGVPLRRLRVLGPRVVPVFSWLQAAVVLCDQGRLPASALAEVVRACMDEAALGSTEVASLLQDLVRRGRVSSHRVAELLASDPSLQALLDRVQKELTALGAGPWSKPARPAGRPDYVAWLREAAS